MRLVGLAQRANLQQGGRGIAHTLLIIRADFCVETRIILVIIEVQ
jgi:hypothetical protein